MSQKGPGPNVKYEGVVWCGWPEEHKPTVGEPFHYAQELGPIKQIAADPYSSRLILEFGEGRVISIPVAMQSQVSLIHT